MRRLRLNIQRSEVTARLTLGDSVSLADLVGLKRALPSQQRDSHVALMRACHSSMHGTAQGSTSLSIPKQVQLAFIHLLQSAAVRTLLKVRGPDGDNQRQRAMLKLDFDAGTFRYLGQEDAPPPRTVRLRLSGGRLCEDDLTLDELLRHFPPATAAAAAAAAQCGDPSSAESLPSSSDNEEEAEVLLVPPRSPIPEPPRRESFGRRSAVDGAAVRLQHEADLDRATDAAEEAEIDRMDRWEFAQHLEDLQQQKVLAEQQAAALRARLSEESAEHQATQQSMAGRLSRQASSGEHRRSRCPRGQQRHHPGHRGAASDERQRPGAGPRPEGAII